jgi:hypothetical protein
MAASVLVAMDMVKSSWVGQLFLGKSRWRLLIIIHDAGSMNATVHRRLINKESKPSAFPGSQVTQTWVSSQLCDLKQGTYYSTLLFLCDIDQDV